MVSEAITGEGGMVILSRLELPLTTRWPPSAYTVSVFVSKRMRTRCFGNVPIIPSRGLLPLYEEMPCITPQEQESWAAQQDPWLFL
eukprot:363132-Chlamydomonas_euryale.AAC.7